MFPLTKLVRTVGGGFGREKVVQTVTWLSDLPKKFAIRLVNESVQLLDASDCLFGYRPLWRADRDRAGCGWSTIPDCRCAERSTSACRGTIHSRSVTRSHDSGRSWPPSVNTRTHELHQPAHTTTSTSLISSEPSALWLVEATANWVRRRLMNVPLIWTLFSRSPH